MSGQKLPDHVEAVYPLSPTQQGMLYHSLHTSGSGMYLGQHCITLEDVNAEYLAQAWQLVVARHASLRSVFAWRGLSNSVQVVYKKAEAALTEVSLNPHEVDNWLSNDATADFDFTSTPPSRAHLIHIGEIVQSSFGHVIIYWSMAGLLILYWTNYKTPMAPLLDTTNGLPHRRLVLPITFPGYKTPIIKLARPIGQMC